MEVEEYALYLAVAPLSLLLTRVARRDLVSIAAALLAAYYASAGRTGPTVLSSLTIVLYPLVRTALASPSWGRRAILVKLKHTWVALALLCSSVPVAYVALGAALHLSPLEAVPLATLIALTLHALVGAVLVRRLIVIVHPGLWRALSLETLERVLWRVGVLVGAITMMANVVVHGALGALLMLAYVVAVLVSGKLGRPASGALVAAVTSAGAAVVYAVGYL